MRSQFGKAEQAALEFFKTKEPYKHSKSPNEIKKLFSQHSLDYILLEGSLKADLLKSKIFSTEEAVFFQTDPVGKTSFCWCAEFFMNGFKLGHTALNLCAQKYIVPVGSDKPFEPLDHSVVLFPKGYQQLYALDSAIAGCFKSCFSIEGMKVSEITLWDVAYKGGGK